jgi:hypothetical protein
MRATANAANKFVPGETITPETLRELRMSALMYNSSVPRASLPESSNTMVKQARSTFKPPPDMEVIDLT